MLGMLNRLIVRTSTSGWLFLAAMVVAFASLSALMQIGKTFPGVAGGAQPFDLQNGLTGAQVLAQLAAYTDEARRQYLLFTAIDYVFPFSAGLFLAAIGAFCLRHTFPGVYAAVNARNLLPLLMLSSLFDWCENVAAITAILAWPGTTAAMATALVAAKKLKLTFLVVTQTLVALLMLATAAVWLGRRWRSR